MLRKITSLLFLILSFWLVGCGSVSSSGSPTPTPTPVVTPTPSPTPSPSPTPTPSTPDSFLTTVFRQDGRTAAAVGTITVDTTANTGAGNLKLTNVGENNTMLILQFCPYPQAFTGCFNVTSFTTDAGGNANVNFTFPQMGSYSGIFQVLQTNSAQFLSTATDSTGVSFKSALLPAGTVTGGIQQTTGNAPGSGTVVMNGATAHITLSSTTPNHTFSTAVCSLFIATPCANLANITTDAQGNASADVGTVQAAGWSDFRISDSDGVEFVTAFRVQ